MYSYDLRPDPTNAEGFCVMGVPVAVTDARVLYLGEDLDAVASVTLVKQVGNVLGKTLEGDTIARMLAELAMLSPIGKQLWPNTARPWTMFFAGLPLFTAQNPDQSTQAGRDAMRTTILSTKVQA